MLFTRRKLMGQNCDFKKKVLSMLNKKKSILRYYTWSKTYITHVHPVKILFCKPHFSYLLLLRKIKLEAALDHARERSYRINCCSLFLLLLLQTVKLKHLWYVCFWRTPKWKQTHTTKSLAQPPFTNQMVHLSLLQLWQIRSTGSFQITLHFYST